MHELARRLSRCDPDRLLSESLALGIIVSVILVILSVPGSF